MARNFAFNFFMKMFSNVAPQVTKDARALGTLTGSLTKINAASRAVSTGAEHATIVLGTAGLAGAALFATSRTATLDEKLSRVAITLGTDVDQLEALRAGLIRVSGQTGRTTEDLAKIAEMAGQAGFSSKLGAEGMVAFADTLSRFTVVAGIGAPEAGRIFTRLADQLKLFEEGTDAAKRQRNIRRLLQLASSIQLVGKNSTSGAAEVARFMEALLPLQQTTKLTIPQMLGIAGAARSFGRVTSELLASQPQRIFQRAFDPKHAERFAQVVGVDSVEALHNLINNDTFEFVMKLLAGLEKAGKTTGDYQRVTKELGLQNLRLIPILAGATSQIQKIRDMTAMAEKEMGGMGEVLREDFNVAMDNFNKQFKIAVVNVDNLAKVAGKPFTRPMTDGLKAVNFGLQNMVRFGDTFIGQLVTMTFMIAPLVSIARLLAVATRSSIAFLGIGGGSALFGTFGIAAFKVGLTAIIAGIKMAIPFFASTFWIAGQIVLAATALWGVFKLFVAAGATKFLGGIVFLVKMVAEHLTVGSIALKDFKKLEEFGLTNIFFGLVSVGQKVMAFVNGFSEGISGITDELDGFGQAFLLIADVLLGVLDMFGAVPLSLRGGVKDFKDAGKAIGASIKFVVSIVNTGFNIVFGGFRRFWRWLRNARILIADFAAYILSVLPIFNIFFKFRGTTIPTNVPQPPPGETAPLQTVASAGGLGATVSELINTIAESGAKASAGGTFGEVFLSNVTRLFIDNRLLGEIQERRKKLDAKRAGAPAI